MKNIFLLAITAVMALTMHAYSFMVDGLYYDITSPTTVSLTYENTSLFTNYHSLSGELEIPSTVYHNYTGTTYRVTAIGTSTFYGCQGLTSVIIPNSVTAIDDAAFDYCHGLTSVTIPNSVTSMGRIAFRGCSGLTSVTIPNSVTSIEGNAFCGCSSLTSIIVDDGNTVYDSRDNCNAIIETASNTLITGCQNTIIPKSVTAIGDNAFDRCTGLTSIDIPNSVTSMGEGVFAGCSSLTSVHIPNSIIAIQSCAFLGCASLTSVNIPNSVTLIGGKAFSGCTDLTRIDSYADPNDVLLGLYAFNGVPKDGTLHVLPQYLEAYQTAEQWCEFTNIVADLQQEDYLPFVREGVKWVYVINRNPFYNIDNDNPAQGDNQFYYTLEIKGDTVINGKTYKAMHKYSGNAINTEADTIPIYLREEDKIVYGIIPDGKFYDGCPVYNLFLESKLIDPYCGEEFVLYDFADPVSYWPEVASPQYTVNITDIEMIQIGSHMAKCYKGDFYGGFSVIEGIGMVCPMNSYTLGFFMPVATGSFGSFYTLSHVVENGEVIYPQNFIDDRYMPLIREDVKWVNERVTVNNGDTTSYYYCYKFKGNHPVKNGYGETFKAMYSYTGESLDMESDGPVAGLRENGALVISYTNQPLNSVIEQDRNLINFYNYQNSNKGHLLYEFAVDAADEMFGIEYYMQYQREPFLTSENLVMLDPIVIDDCICSRCVYLDDDGLPLAYIVEGIGFDSYDMGDLLTPFTRKPDPAADHQEWCGLSHVVKDGQIIYKGLRYSDNVHVGINEVVTDVPQRQLDGNYYNLMGQPVGKDVPTVPGIYIHQGKKILVR